MKDGPVIAGMAALLGDPARANMLTALMDGRALTVSELAQAGGVALPTASGHLSKLAAAGLLLAERQGRHRYFRLSGPDIAAVLEGLMGLAQRTGAVRVRAGPGRGMRPCARPGSVTTTSPGNGVWLSCKGWCGRDGSAARPSPR